MRTEYIPIVEEIPSWENISTNSRYGRYASGIEKQAILRALFLAKKPATALDIGCDGGRWAMLLASRGWEMICTDIAQQSLDICKQRVPNATCICVSSNDTTLPSESEQY